MNHVMHFMPENDFTKALHHLNDLVWDFISENEVDWSPEDSIWDLILVLGDQSAISVSEGHAQLYWSEDGEQWTHLDASNDLNLINDILRRVEEFDIVEWDLD